MKRSLLLLLLAGSTLSLSAQTQWRIQLSAAAQRTHFSNASDNKSGSVDVTPEIMPAGGFRLSRVNGAKSGFQGFSVGLEFVSYQQSTYAENTSGTDPRLPKVATNSQLHYLSLPIEMRFGITAKRGLTPFVTLGGFVSKLLSSREDMEVQIYNTIDGDYGTRFFSIANKEVSTWGSYRNMPLDWGTENLKKGIYRSWNWGLLASLGTDFSIGERHLITVRIPFRFSVTDAERKEKLVFENAPSGTQQSYSYTAAQIYMPSEYYWNNNSPKGIALYQDNPSNEVRSATHLFSYGFEISYGLRLLPGKNLREATN